MTQAPAEPALSGSTDGLDRLRVLHGRQSWLCDRLEQFADQLPQASAGACLRTIWALTTVVGPLHSIEEACFFPLLRGRLPDSPDLMESIDRSCQEHLEDRDATIELVASIRGLGAGVGRREIDVLSYQLRAFFVGLRRHEAREREVLLPRAAAAFTAADRDALRTALDRSFGN